MSKEHGSLTTVAVGLFGDVSSIIKFQVKQSSSVSAETILSKVCQLVGLSADSSRYFTLVHGRQRPTRRYRPTDRVSLPCDDLTLHKWTFAADSENSLFADPTAVQLLCKHANYLISQGLLVLPEEHLASGLEFLTLCHSIPSYGQVCFADCDLIDDFSPPRHTFPGQSRIDVGCSVAGLEVACRDISLRWPWREVQNWSFNNSDAKVRLTFMLCGSRSVLHFSTPQTPFFSAVLMENIQANLKQRRRETKYFASDIKKSGGWLTYDNLLYDPGVANPVYDDSPTGELCVEDSLTVSHVCVKLS